jgi:hypothetical protein
VKEVQTITKEEQLHIHNYFKMQNEYADDNCYWKKDESKYILDLVTRDWKMQGTMRSPYQVRQEMEHQKKLATSGKCSFTQARIYFARVQFASWVLGDSDTF